MTQRQLSTINNYIKKIQVIKKITHFVSNYLTLVH